MILQLIAALFIGVAFAQQQPSPPQPSDELFWCKQQRNFFADTAAQNAAEAAKLMSENAKLKNELEELKKKLDGGKN